MATPTADSLIAKEGDQAYWAAVGLTMAASMLGDTEWAEACADVAKELMQRGYHKFPKTSKDVRNVGTKPRPG